MKIAFVAEHVAFTDGWNTPKGIHIALEKLGHENIEFGYDPNNCNFDNLVNSQDKYDFIIMWTCGHHPSLDNEISLLKKRISKKIIMEVGDEPQTKWMNVNRVSHVDAVFTPDLRCHLDYKSRGINSYWLVSWGDESVFYYDESINRENRCITTCGNREGVDVLQNRLGNLFINRRIPSEENHDFYNSGTICFQRSSSDQVTRRIFEAGGCKLAVVNNNCCYESGLNRLFKHGEDILYYENTDEALHQINNLIKDHDYRNHLSNNIYNKVNRYHRSERRANQLLDIYNELTNNEKLPDDFYYGFDL